jgi:hypothetical protein
LESDSAQSDARGAPDGAQDGAHDPAGTDPQSPADSLPEITSPAITGQSSPPAGQPLDADLVRVVEAWPTLTEPIRRAILAMVEASGGVR